MKTRLQGTSLLIFLLAVASILPGCSDGLKTSDLVGPYDLMKYHYWQGGADGHEVAWYPPDISGILEFSGDETYSLRMTIRGREYESSGTYEATSSAGGTAGFVELFPSEGGSFIGTCSNDGHRIGLISTFPGSGGTLVFEKR